MENTMSTEMKTIRCEVDGKQFCFSFDVESNYTQVKWALCQFVKDLCNWEDVLLAQMKQQQEQSKCEAEKAIEEQAKE